MHAFAFVLTLCPCLLPCFFVSPTNTSVSLDFDFCNRNPGGAANGEQQRSYVSCPGTTASSAVAGLDATDGCHFGQFGVAIKPIDHFGHLA